MFIPNAVLSGILVRDFLNLTAETAREVPMEFICHTTYDQKALTAMARAIRKTVRARKSRRTRLYAWVIIGLLLLSVSRGEISGRRRRFVRSSRPSC